FSLPSPARKTDSTKFDVVLKSGGRSGRTRSYALIEQLSKQESVEVVCSAFDVARSCYYVHRLRRRRVDAR
ncbi:UNVERIFIED_CONTAM: hypothetical protein QOZ54_29805, partial [Pseudomonas aeruginosa]